MYSIIINHVLTHGKAIKKFSRFNELKLLNIFAMWDVSGFGVISGLVGYKSHKYANLFYLWNTAVFYSLLFYIIYNKLSHPIINVAFISNIFPVIHENYWYFTAYFGIYPFIPFINSGISLLSKIEFKKCI